MFLDGALVETPLCWSGLFGVETGNNVKNQWNEAEAAACGDDPLAMRVYSSRLIGREAALVLHGGGNTSVKAPFTDVFGEVSEVLFVKGSGWDLATIEGPGFAPVRLTVLKKMAQLSALSDPDMVAAQRVALLDAEAPNPSVEAILHAIIPFRYVDHSHADAVVTVSNTPEGEAAIRSIYGDRVLVVPYVMPGFDLARAIWRMTQEVDWTALEGIVLMSHGLFTFADDARESYRRMIDLVTEAEDFLGEGAPLDSTCGNVSALALATLRSLVSRSADAAMLARFDGSPCAYAFACREDAGSVATRGPLTPDHVIRTKRVPLLVTDQPEKALAEYESDYQTYFDAHTRAGQQMLDPAPRWALWPGSGTVSFGRSMKDVHVVADIIEHTVEAIIQAECHGGWKALPASDIFDVEYWDLEQAKLRKGSSAAEFQGRIALVTGAASGIGQACLKELLANGAVVAALDVNPLITEQYETSDVLGIQCDVTNSDDVTTAIETAVLRFGGLDIVVSNAGIFTESAPISEMKDEDWSRSLDVNLSAAMRLLRVSVPYLVHGIDPSIVIVGSKNVSAPGPGAAAYSAAKAGLTQLARVAALELASSGIRINTVHPNAVFDTSIWTNEVLQARANHYGLSVDEYRTSNLLGTQVSSQDVARMVCAMAGSLFAKTTGAQVPVDGGTERVV